MLTVLLISMKIGDLERAARLAGTGLRGASAGLHQTVSDRSQVRDCASKIIMMMIIDVLKLIICTTMWSY